MLHRYICIILYVSKTSDCIYMFMCIAVSVYVYMYTHTIAPDFLLDLTLSLTGNIIQYIHTCVHTYCHLLQEGRVSIHQLCSLLIENVEWCVCVCVLCLCLNRHYKLHLRKSIASSVIRSNNWCKCGFCCLVAVISSDNSSGSPHSMMTTKLGSQ